MAESGSSNIRAMFEAEMAHLAELRRKYDIWSTADERPEEVDICDSARVIIIMKQKFNETEEQVIARLQASDIDNPIRMDNEVFWLEKE